MVVSNTKLESAAAGNYGLPHYPPNLGRFQHHYETRRHKAHPMTEERLREFANDLKLLAMGDMKFQPDFITEDGTKWMVVGFRYMTGNKYKLAFPKEEDPKHRDGTVSAQHVALYCLDDEVSLEELDYVAQATYAIFHTFSH